MEASQENFLEQYKTFAKSLPYKLYQNLGVLELIHYINLLSSEISSSYFLIS
jgi:hypothetical protein